MSYHVFFSFSTGVSKTLTVPKGTRERIWSEIKLTEEILGLQRTPTFTLEGEKPRPGWRWHQPAADILRTAGPAVDTKLPQWWLIDRDRDAKIEQMAGQVREHNAFVRRLYEDFETWCKKKPDGKTEKISPAQSVEFWGGLATLDLPRTLWTKDHFRAHMEHLLELLTKGESDGVYLGCKPFSLKQADALINLFEAELDQWGYDMRFSVPLDERLKPCDFLATSDDGGYDWCSKCGPINSEDFHARCAICSHAKKGKCDLKNSHPGEFDDE
jgi:hypothetical protein